MAGLLWGGLAPDPPLPFLPLMEEKEAKEDQGAKGRRPNLLGTCGTLDRGRGSLPDTR